MFFFKLLLAFSTLYLHYFSPSLISHLLLLIDWMEPIYHVEAGSSSLGFFVGTCMHACMCANIHVYGK